jgi:hypothetical protein
MRRNVSEENKSQEPGANSVSAKKGKYFSLEA